MFIVKLYINDIQKCLFIKKTLKIPGVNEAEEVFERFQAQRETCKRLNYLQQTTEEEKLELEGMQTSLLNELEAFKFASVKDKDEYVQIVQADLAKFIQKHFRTVNHISIFTLVFRFELYYGGDKNGTSPKVLAVDMWLSIVCMQSCSV